MAIYLGNNKVSLKSGCVLTGFKDFLEHGGKFSDTNYTDLTGILKYDDTENVTNMGLMFDSCNELVSIPLLDTSKVISMYMMFGYCQKISSIPKFNTSNVSRMDSMFTDCSNLITIPLLDTSKVTNMSQMFNYCTKLTSIPRLDVSKVTNTNNMFHMCSELAEIHMIGMKVKFDISSSTKFTREALIEILNNLATVTDTQTLTMGSTNLAKLTDVDKQIATNKGWTLA